MNEDADQRLSKITTLWSIVGRAHGDDGDAAREARQLVLEQYGGAVRRYVLGALHNADAADEVFQNFAVQFLKGRLRGADPKRGRFREYLKGVLFRLVADHHRARAKQPMQIADDSPEAVDKSGAINDDDGFLKSWCDELMLQAWNAVEQLEQESGTPYYTVLRMRTEQPGVPSHVLSEQLSSELGKPYQAAAVRQTLRRARDKFADFLLQNVIGSLQNPTSEELECELIDLGLQKQCQAALERWSHAGTESN